MKKGILVAMALTAVTATAQVNELLYVEKSFEKSQSTEFALKTYTHSQKSMETIEEVKERMINSGKYKFVELNHTLYEVGFFNRFRRSKKKKKKTYEHGWHLENTSSRSAHEMIENPHEVIVAVCDSGYEEGHPDLAGSSIPGYSLVDESYDTSPNTHHGTMVSGIIIGKENSVANSSGIAPFVKIMPLKISTTKGGASLSRIANCIKYGADNGAKVINVSFTGVNYKSIEEAGRYARAKGALLVYSAGNHGFNRGKWPDHKNVLVVGGTQSRDKRWNCNKWYRKCGSNYGHFIDIVAPAKKVFTTRANITFGGDAHKAANGTSFAAPIVSAIAALVYSVNPDFTPEQVEEILFSTAKKLGRDYVYGKGIVNAEKAVELALELSN